MPANPFLSVIIATYNAASTVEAAIESVLCQTFNDLELVIVDGVSSDETVGLVERFKKIDHRVALFIGKDKGIYDAWNKGVSYAKGEWVIFIGADDKFTDPTVITRFVELLSNGERAHKANIYYSDLVVCGEDGSPMDRIGGPWRDPWSTRGRFVDVDFPIPIMASFFRRSVLLDLGGFDLTYRIIADIELVLRSAKEALPVYLPGIDVTTMGYGGISTNPMRSMLLWRESVAVRGKHNIGMMLNVGFWRFSFKQAVKYMLARFGGKKVLKFLLGKFQDRKRKNMSVNNT